MSLLINGEGGSLRVIYLLWECSPGSASEFRWWRRPVALKTNWQPVGGGVLGGLDILHRPFLVLLSRRFLQLSSRPSILEEPPFLPKRRPAWRALASFL